MVEVASTDKCWILLGQHFDQKRERGLSEREAEQEIRRELVQNLIPCRWRDQYGNFANPPPDWFWPRAHFDFTSSWVAAPLPADPLAPEMVRIARQVEQNKRVVQRMFGSPAASGINTGEKGIKMRSALKLCKRIWATRTSSTPCATPS